MKHLSVGIAALTLGACTIGFAQADSFVPSDREATSLSDFDGVKLEGGGDLLILHGSDHSFENTGSENTWLLEIEDHTLVVTCQKPCRSNVTRKATITLSELQNLALVGGGDIEIKGGFPASDEFNIALTGGGDIDALDINAKEVNIALIGGGDIEVSASDELNISIVGGGDISYRGNPEVHKVVLGGGRVHRVD